MTTSKKAALAAYMSTGGTEKLPPLPDWTPPKQIKAKKYKPRPKRQGGGPIGDKDIGDSRTRPHWA